MPSSSRSFWHTPATGELQQEDLRPTAPESGGSATWKNLCGLQMLPRPVTRLENAMLAMKGWNHSSRGCLSSPPVDCPTGKTACPPDALLLPQWTGWPGPTLTWFCAPFTFLCTNNDYRHIEPSHHEAVAGVLCPHCNCSVSAKQNYSGLLWSNKQLSICPLLPLTVFCPGASSEPCPERWMGLKASSVADRACGELCPLSSRFQPVWQLKQSLLIVNNMQVIDVSARLRAALLGDVVSWKGREILYYSKFMSCEERWSFSILY